MHKTIHKIVYKLVLFFKIDSVLGFFGRRNFGMAVVERLSPPVEYYKKNDLRIIELNQIKFKVQMNDLMSQPLFFGIGMEDVLCLKNIFPAKASVIDVGANVGRWSLLVSKLYKTQKIYSFEPFQSTYQNLLANLQLNQKYNIEALPLAASDKIEFVSMKTKSPTNSGMNSITASASRHNNYETTTTIETTSLDAYFLEKMNIEKIDVIKIDVEGYEKKVLWGAKKLIQKFSPFIICEIDDSLLSQNKTSPNEVFQFLEGLNYTIKKLPHLEIINSSMIFKNIHFDIIACPENRSTEGIHL